MEINNNVTDRPFFISHSRYLFLLFHDNSILFMFAFHTSLSLQTPPPPLSRYLTPKLLRSSIDLQAFKKGVMPSEIFARFEIIFV